MALFKAKLADVKAGIAVIDDELIKAVQHWWMNHIKVVPALAYLRHDSGVFSTEL